MFSANAETISEYPLRLTINAISLLLFLKVYFFATSQNQMHSVYLVSFVQDAFLLVAIYALFVVALGSFPRLRAPSLIFFMLFYSLVTLASLGYTFFLIDFVNFPISVFSVTASAVTIFMESFMGASRLSMLSGGIVFLFAISWFFPRQIRWRGLLGSGMIALTVLFVPTIFGPPLNPLVYSVQEQIRLANSENADIRRLNSPVADDAKGPQFVFLNKAFSAIPHIDSKYDRVVVLVMEGINAANFAARSQAEPHSFVNLHKDHTISFTNYHTLNLDSFTSLLAMLNSIFVPYQAYTNVNKYAFVNERNNLVRFFNANGFGTYFFTSAIGQPDRFVPDRYEWTQVGSPAGVDETGRYTCITSNEIEYSCEDLIMLDDILATLRATPHAFVLHEMIYGHTAEWEEKTGLDPVDYYNRYFVKLVDGLRENGLLDSTLLVIISDHGPRGDAYVPDNYHIPLLVFATDLAQNENPSFLSHVDFKDILLEFLAGQTLVPSAQPIYTIGSSGEWIYGKIEPNGQHIFINNRMRHVEGNAPEKEVKKLNRDFQDYLNYFTWLGRNPQPSGMERVERHNR